MPHRRLPIGPDAVDWLTTQPVRTVLAVVHNVTALTRLVDVLDAFEADLRVQTVFTVTGSSPFDDGISERLTDLGCIVIPWQQALTHRFDLAISASKGGDIHDLNAPIVIVPHGLGYNKYLQPGEPESRRAGEPESRRAGEPESRRAGEPESRAVFGLSPEWLLHEGKAFASAIVLSHDEQLARLRRYCPQAVEAATVAGDPCLDRLRASLHLRDSYRHALGLTPTRRLIVLSSTWGKHSLHGRHPDLALGLARDLPIDRYQIAVALHPNVWHGHSPWQIKSWLAAARRAGVLVLSPWEQWRAALIAADAVVGDFGSVPLYAAAIGRPVLVAATHPDGLDPASPVARFTAAAPALALGESLGAQLEAVIADPGRAAYASILDEATAAPGRSAALLRAAFYRWMDLPEPDHPAVTPVVAIPAGDEVRSATPTAVVAATRLSGDAGTLRMSRFPAALRLADPPPGDSHLLVEWRHHDPSLMTLADVLVCRPDDTFDAPEAWIRRTLHDFPGCVVAAVGGGPECVVGVRGSAAIRLSGDRERLPATVLASAVHGWLAAGRSLDQIDGTAVLLDGNVLVRLRARPAASPPAVPRPSPPAEQTSSSTPQATP